MFWNKEVRIIVLSLSIILGLFALLINNINQSNIQASNNSELAFASKKLQKKLDTLKTTEQNKITQEIDSKLAKKEIEAVFNGFDTKQTDINALVNIDKQGQGGQSKENLTIIAR
jgi:hypothetical protein